MTRLHEHEPPRFSAWLLAVLAPSERREVLLGDFEEGFAEMVDYLGAARARRWYRVQVWRSIPALLFQSMYWGVVMLKSYLKTAFRNLTKHKGHAFINIGGLATGMACCLLVVLFIRNEWTYDRFHERADRLYRAWVLEDYGEDQRFFNTVTPFPLGPALAQAYPEVEAYVRVVRTSNLVRHGATSISETIHLVDPDFFEVFDFPLVAGEPSAVFKELNTVVLSERFAARYFADADPVGQTLAMEVGDRFEDFVVTGVAEDVPTNSSIQFDVLVPFEKGTGWQWGERAQEAWFNVTPETYIALRADAEVTALEAKFPDLVAGVLGDRVEPGQYTIGLQPMTGIHLDPDMPLGIATVSDPSYSYILGAIALFVLLIACINFMTLSIGRSAGRALEVGVRKVMGADRGQLMRQFWGEALLMTGLALVIGLALARAFLPLFNDLAGQQLALRLDASLFVAVAALLAVVGLASGGYPALVLSRFRPVEVLKGSLRVSGDASLLRRTLVVVQFSLSIFLIASTLLMRDQLHYLQTRSLGFDKEQVVVVPTNLQPDDGMPLAERFRNELEGRPGIVSVAAARYTFAAGSWLNAGYYSDGGAYRFFNINVVDHDYVSTLGLEIVQGRDFSREITADQAQAVLVNEAFVAEYGWEDPLAAHIPGDFGDHQIIGVVRDFNYASLHTEVEPLALVLDLDALYQGIADVNSGQARTPKILVRIRPDDLPATVALLERTWNTASPGQAFSYSFLDEAVDSQYRQEERLGQMVGIASMLSILIACLGVFGLAALSVARRTKEIGVRKVMGASIPQIVVLLSRDFTVLILIAFALAVPATYLFMDPWLADFAYRVGIGPVPFLLSGMAALVIAWLTVGYQSIRAALANPVKALRYE
jgi:putative ABC transport system permease protein